MGFIAILIVWFVIEKEGSRTASSEPSYAPQNAHDPFPTLSSPRTPSNYGQSFGDDAFLNALAVDPFFDGVPRADAIAAAHEVCNTLDTGMYDVYSVGTAALNNGFDVDSTLVFVASAVGAYCEEYETQF